MNEKISTLIKNLESNQLRLQDYINDIESDTDESLKNSEKFQKLKRFTEAQIPRVMTFLRDNAEILQYEDFLEDAYNSISTLRSNILSIQAKSHYEIEKIINGVNSFNSQFSLLSNGVSAVKQSRDLVETTIKPKLDELDEKIKDVEAARQALAGAKTEEIYAKASDNFLEYARVYDLLFYILLGGSVLFTTVNLIYFPYTDTTKVNFILSKILTFSIVITLGTLFLRKASHLRKQYDQAYQTSLELQALPLYLENIDVEHHSEIYKNLAEKYFGKELDQTQNDKIGDLMQEQLSAGTELVRASAELVRAKSESGGNESKSESGGNEENKT
ncbi:hypothetical protein A7P53_15080 [Acinetobacter defluvii]|uniref:hypothetical protein n=1 Tax=Acinetobacter defluvii TaxID=1871111 RepID=UPI00148F68D8|nr:hypothetical protein [Acinetobacter defluvii]NNP73907.1 hypothetical protein [Acinetobacter defluvii]